MPKRELQGIVVSDKGDKTVIVNVERRITLFLKKLLSGRKSSQPDETNSCKAGQTVKIENVRQSRK